MDIPLSDIEPECGLFIVPATAAANRTASSGAGADREQVGAFTELVATLRRFQNDLAAAAPTTAELRDMTLQLGRMGDTLSTRRVEEEDRIAGRVWHVPGRAQFLSPPYRWHEISEDHCVGTVEFGQMYLGSLAVHGGALPLVYDEVMGSLANRAATARARTVNLCVRYRALTPVDTPLDLEVHFNREEGRKRFLSARMTLDGVLLSEAEGIFVTLLPGQR